MLESIRREWVTAKLENALTVLLIWIAAFIPWNVAHNVTKMFELYYLRWGFFQVRWINGEFHLMTLLEAYQLQSASPEVQQAYLIWGIGTAALVLTVLYSVALFLFEDSIASYARPARVGGGLLLITGGLYAVSSYLLSTSGFPGLEAPVGAFIMLIFSAVLLTNHPHQNDQQTRAEQPTAQ